MSVYLICSAGGHLTELLYATGDSLDSHDVTLLTYEDMGIKNVTFIEIVNPHRSPIRFVICTMQTLKIFLRRPPTVLISSGAGIALPGIILAKSIFRAKVVFIESLAYINKSTYTGRIAYYFSDVFFVQHKDLLKTYKKAILGRLL
jgi:UDP-N-acetylglucosamine:LPS N-acetylglucosamine transferase